MTNRIGDQVGRIDSYVLRYSQTSGEDVTQNIYVSELDLQANTKYALVVSRKNQSIDNARIGTTVVRTDKEAKNATLPISFIREHEEMRPGQNVSLTFYEHLPPQNQDFVISDDSSILGRSEVVADPSVSDGCDARLTCKNASKAIRSGGEMLKFRNTRTQKEETVQSHADFESDKYQVSFPIEARRSIDAKPTDLIEIIRPASNKIDNDKEQAELVRETHRMVSEMYEAYLQQVND
jgi:hypothetical protein